MNGSCTSEPSPHMVQPTPQPCAARFDCRVHCAHSNAVAKQLPSLQSTGVFAGHAVGRPPLLSFTTMGGQLFVSAMHWPFGQMAGELSGHANREQSAAEDAHAPVGHATRPLAHEPIGGHCDEFDGWH